MSTVPTIADVCVFVFCDRTSRLGRASYLPPSLRGSVMSSALSDDGSLDENDAADDSTASGGDQQSTQQNSTNA